MLSSYANIAVAHMTAADMAVRFRLMGSESIPAIKRPTGACTIWENSISIK